MDREKVMKGLECCSEPSESGVLCSECPYWGDNDNKDELVHCNDNLCKDALVMLKEQQQQIWELQDQVEYLTDKLKEQEAVKPALDKQTGRIWLCGKCGTYVGFEDNDPHDPNEFDKYCRECGRPVLWEGR